MSSSNDISLNSVSNSLFLTAQQNLALFPIQFALQDFYIIECISRQRNSVVWLANYKYASQALVLKEIDTTNFQPHHWVNVQRELVSVNIKHPSILTTHGYFFDSPKVFFVLEHAEGGNLYKALKNGGPFPEAKVRKTMVQIMDAVVHLHSENIIHRDLKLDNVLLRSPGNFDSIIVADFGVCFPRVAGRIQPVTVVGTLDYMSPEILSSESDNNINNYDEKVDVWALGIMCYEMLHGAPPFADADIGRTCYNITNSGFHVSSTLSEHCLDFICTALKKNAMERPNAHQLAKHPWIALPRPERPRVMQVGRTENARVQEMYAEFLLQQVRCEILHRKCTTITLHTDCPIARQLISTLLRMKQYEVIAKPTLQIDFSHASSSDVYLIDTTPHNLQAIRLKLRSVLESHQRPMLIALVTVVENRLPRLLADTFNFYLHKPVERVQMQVFPPVVRWSAGHNPFGDTSNKESLC